MIDLPVHEQFRLARTARGESLEAVARRTGIRVEWVQAMDEGRFGNLPTGIYARASVRTYAAALELDVHAILMRCTPLLPVAEDPIQAMRRLNGIAPLPSPQTEHPIDRTASTLPYYRVIVASVIDASTMAVTLLVLVTCIVAMGLSVTSLDRSAAGPLVAVMLLVAVLYYIVFGGIVVRRLGNTSRAVAPRNR